MTVEVGPKQAEQLTVAGRIGVLSLSLRSTEEGVESAKLDTKSRNGALSYIWERDEGSIITPAVADGDSVVSVFRGSNSGEE